MCKRKFKKKLTLNIFLHVKDVHTQGKTLECLANKIGDLHDGCRKQLLRVAELQADDYHLDRQLYYACREDRERLCADVPAGGGKIYECLFKHKFDKMMSTQVGTESVLQTLWIIFSLESSLYNFFKRNFTTPLCWHINIVNS